MKLCNAQYVPLFLLLCPAPPPPGGVIAMATSGSSINVTWTPPTLPDNRPPVTGYTVTAVPSSGSTPELLPATATSTVLSGLQRGTVYTIKVVAHSVVGDSMPRNYTIDLFSKCASSVGKVHPLHHQGASRECSETPNQQLYTKTSTSWSQ